MFTQASFDFLNELSVNNDRQWFKANQPRYEQQVREPALQFIDTMRPAILALSPRLTAVPKKVGGSMMRPQRDSRFSKNATPYKTNVGIQFRHFQAKDVHTPGLYVHIANDGCFIGAGIWQPASPALHAIRGCIDENPNSYKKALKTLTQAGFNMEGKQLVRPPRGYDNSHPLLDELKRKDFIAIKPISIAQVCSPNFSDFCANEFEHCQSLMRYLCFALDLDY